MASGGEPGTGEEDQRSGGPVVDLQPNLKTIQVCRKYEINLYGHKIKQCIIVRPIRSSGSTEGALEEAGRAEQHIITKAAPNELKLGEGA